MESTLFFDLRYALPLVDQIEESLNTNDINDDSFYNSPIKTIQQINECSNATIYWALNELKENKNLKNFDVFSDISNYYNSVFTPPFEKYIYNSFVKNPSVFKEIIKFYFNNFSKLYSVIKNVSSDDSFSSLTPELKNDICYLKDSINTQRYFLSNFLELEYAELTLKDYIMPSNASSIQFDKRMKYSHISTPEIAYTINHILNSRFAKLKKEEKIIFLNSITGRSGKDLYANLSGNKLSPSDKIRIETELKWLKDKLK